VMPAASDRRERPGQRSARSTCAVSAHRPGHPAGSIERRVLRQAALFARPYDQNPADTSYEIRTSARPPGGGPSEPWRNRRALHVI
jgi:hypothetical protein